MLKNFNLYLIILSLTPLFFWTLTPNIFATPKELAISLLTCVLLLTSAAKLAKHHSVALPSFTSILPLFIFILGIAGSLIANPEGRPEALQSKGLILLVLPLLSLLLLTAKNLRSTSYFIASLVTVGSLLSIHSLASLLVLSKSIYVPSYMQSLSFTPTGSYQATLFLILLSIPLLITLLRTASKMPRIWLYLLLAIHVIASITIFSLMLPNGALSTQALPFNASWSIALDALKSLRSLFFGIGLSNYGLLYTAVKPLFINYSDLWNIVPSSAFNEILTLLPTAGIIAIFSFLFLMFKLLFNSYSTILFLPSLIITLSFFVTPGNTITYLVFFLLYAYAIPHKNIESPVSKPLSYFLASILLVLATMLAASTYRSFMSERYMRLAQQKLSAADTQNTYQYHLKAMQVSPKITNYHLSFADINFRLASTLSQKSDLTDADRETITRLIKQSVESGKSAISLRPNDPRTWLTIAKIYQNLINVAENSDTFALEAYARTISLDRANPSLRLEYANLLSQIADTKKEATESSALQTRAASEIQIAIQLKPDFGNAYYNLALLYKRVNDLDAAKKALEKTLQYLTPDSQEYLQVQNELANLKNPPTPSPTPDPASDTLATPTPSTDPNNDL